MDVQLFAVRMGRRVRAVAYRRRYRRRPYSTVIPGPIGPDNDRLCRAREERRPCRSCSPASADCDGRPARAVDRVVWREVVGCAAARMGFALDLAQSITPGSSFGLPLRSLFLCVGPRDRSFLPIVPKPHIFPLPKPHTISGQSR